MRDNQPSPLTPSDCERLAREVVRPVMEWCRHEFGLWKEHSYPEQRIELRRKGWVAIGTAPNRATSAPAFTSAEAAQLYAESRLREATLPLHAPRIAALEARVAKLREALGSISDADQRGLEWEEATDIAEAALKKDDANHAD